MDFPDDLSALLARLDPQAPLAERHLWLIALLRWVRGDGRSASESVGRVRLLVAALEARPELQPGLRDWWSQLQANVDGTTLLADLGFAPRIAFFSELGERLRRKLLPSTPETVDAAELFALALSGRNDARWLQLLDEPLLQRLRRLLQGDDGACALRRWQHTLLEAITYCASQVRAAGFAPELRLRMAASVRDMQPFHALPADVETLRCEVLRTPRDEAALREAAQRLRERLDVCRHAASSVYAHLEEHGISVGLVFRLRQLRQRVLRVRDLLDGLLSPTPAQAAARLLATLVTVNRERSSVRALIASNSSLLAAKVTERSAETGEHYITHDRGGYGAMLRKAAGGGALTSLTVWLKFMILAMGLTAFWSGFWTGFSYAVGFVLIHLLHCTLATKQPAMTAPAMAAKLKKLHTPEAVESFVDEVARLVRSQVAAVLGNVFVVFPCVLLLSAAAQATLGAPMIGPKEAEHVLDSLTLLGPTLLFAAFTGVLLFASSIIAGWVENWFVLHRLDSALRYNPRITTLLGRERAGRWAGFMRANISGLASNISLGFMLGLIPAFAQFFGLGLDVRHVTLSTGQLAAACAAFGWAVVRLPVFWWCVASLPLIGALNVSVSFYFAFRLALRADNVSGVDRARIRAAIYDRWRRRPVSFFLPE